jgi:large subunit ribosomal protein L29
MKAADIRKFSVTELNKKIADLKAELFNLRFQHAVGQLENPARLKSIRKTIAQMKTIMSEKGDK